MCLMYFLIDTKPPTAVISRLAPQQTHSLSARNARQRYEGRMSRQSGQYHDDGMNGNRRKDQFAGRLAQGGNRIGVRKLRV